MAATRRLTRELSDLVEAKMSTLRNIESSDESLLMWTGLLVPEKAPYNKGAFRIEINFPPQYPFMPQSPPSSQELATIVAINQQHVFHAYQRPQFFYLNFEKYFEFLFNCTFFLAHFFYRITVHLMRHTYILANIQNMDNLCLTSFN